MGHRNFAGSDGSPGDRRHLGERERPERRRRGQRAPGGQELRLADRQLRPVLSGSARQPEDVRGRDGAADGLLGAGDRDIGPDASTPATSSRNWKNNLFAGGMRQGEVPRSGHLERIDFNEKWEELHRESMLRELQQRIRDVRQGPDGFLYVLTAETDGVLMRLEPAPMPPASGRPRPRRPVDTMTPPFRAEHVGSLLRPEKLLKARAAAEGDQYRQATGPLHLRRSSKEIEDEAIREVVRLQEDVGLQVVTDGEFRRRSWFQDFMLSLTGTEITFVDSSQTVSAALPFQDDPTIDKLPGHIVRVTEQADAREGHLHRALQVPEERRRSGRRRSACRRRACCISGAAGRRSTRRSIRISPSSGTTRSRSGSPRSRRCMRSAAATCRSTT